MGAVCSCCQKQDPEVAPNGGQYESLVATKPAPIILAKVTEDADERMDGVPLFAPAKSDEENPVSDPETLTDTELNLYASKLNEEEEK